MVYANSFYNPTIHNCQKQFSTDDRQLIEHNGHLICKRSTDEYHVIKDVICISMRAGINGAKHFIDNQNQPTKHQ